MIKMVSVEEAVEMLENDRPLELWDIRKHGIYKGEHATGARSMETAMFQVLLEGCGCFGKVDTPKTTPIIVYGNSTVDAMNAAGILNRNGYVLVYVLTGGLSAWKQASLPISLK